ncbi:MAG: TlpA family protein disulfide reductase [Candidatus Firestonebacteria bacterium]|nr:TlpA family protein disulfide reductase [Candidatus Firestonebacteria bacterium]
MSKFNSICCIFLFLFIISFKTNAEIVNYDSSLFSIGKNNWVMPFNFYNKAVVTKVSENDIVIDLGSKHGIQKGMIYDIYQSDPSKIEARICIISIDKYSSQAYYIKKPKFADSILPGYKAAFTGLIETRENLSYVNRLEREISGKITILEGELCFINIQSSPELQSGQIFNVFNEKKTEIGEIEIIQTVKKGDSIALIKKQKEPFHIGDVVNKTNRSHEEWLYLARFWAAKDDAKDDGVYAYKKAIYLGIPPETISNELGTFIFSLAQQYENEGDFGKAIYYWSLCKNFNSNCDENYNFVSKKALVAGKIFWDKKEWLEVIKKMEYLPQSEEVQKYISASYNFLGKEVENKNHDMAIYCYEQSFRISNSNMFALKNLVNIYFQDVIFDKAIFWVKKIKNIADRDDDKNWAEIKEEEITRVNENRPPNYTFTNFQGKELALDTFRGRVILLVLWNSSDVSSSSEIDFLKNFYRKYEDKKLTILAVHNARDSNAVRSYISKSGSPNFDIVFANDNTNVIFSDSMNLPQNVILDKKGKIVYQKTGLFENELKEIIDGLLLEQ